MRRHLLSTSLLVGLCCLSGPCLAGLTIYGRIYAELATETQGEDAAETDTDTLDDAQGLGRIGLRFTQSLEGDLSAFGKYEWQMDAAEGSGFNARDAYVGLNTPYGSIALGRFNGLYKTTGGADFDPFYLTGLEARNHGGMSGGPFGTTGFISRAVEYRIPEWQMGANTRLNAGVQYAYGEDTSTTADGTAGSVLAAATVAYKQLEVVAAYSQDGVSELANSKFGVRLREGNLTYFAQTENVEMGGFDTAGVGTFLLGGVEYQHDKWRFAVQAGNYSSEQDQADAAYFSVGAHYSLAQNVHITVGYRGTDSDIATLSSTAAVLGMRYDF